jgi:hypothetical protein
MELDNLSTWCDLVLFYVCDQIDFWYGARQHEDDTDHYFVQLDGILAKGPEERSGD